MIRVRACNPHCKGAIVCIAADASGGTLGFELSSKLIGFQTARQVWVRWYVLVSLCNIPRLCRKATVKWLADNVKWDIHVALFECHINIARSHNIIVAILEYRLKCFTITSIM